MTKKEVKNVVTGAWCSTGGASKERILVKFDNWCEKVKNLGERLKKVVRNFARGIQNIFEGIQEPRSLAPGIQQPLHATAAGKDR